MTNDKAADRDSLTYGELLRNRRSTRRYLDRPVSAQVVLDMIQESTLAPSAGNAQPWKFVIVHDPATIQKISDESKKNILARIEADPDDYAQRYERMLRNASFNVFYDAPCLVMILGPSSLKNLRVDCALAASYFMMAAASRGLGTCWVNLGAEVHDPRLRAELGIPSDHTIVAPISVGYPEKIPPAPKRKAPEILKVVERSSGALPAGDL